MGIITLSISDKMEEKLRKLAKKERRSMSKQVEYLIMIGSPSGMKLVEHEIG